MAFEIPLDADRVDGLNVFSTIMHAPVIGTLFWMFGGGSKGHDQQQQQDSDDDDGVMIQHRLDDDNDYEYSTYYEQSTEGRRGECFTTTRQQQHGGKLKKAAPSLIGSEISESELVESLDAVSLYGYAGSYSLNYNSGIGKKKLSWSDDVGKNLVIYETESSIHEPKPCYEQPTRPALVRSRSIRSDADHLGTSQIENKFIPTQSHRPTKPIIKHHHSMPYPSQHHHHHQTVEPYSSGTNGYESPQWGWYINTTPPSPEMFHSTRSIITSSTRKGVHHDSTTSATSDTSRESTISTVSGGGHPTMMHHHNTVPNPVFQCLQDKHRTTPAGWPSVPL